MVKIAFWDNYLGERGTTVALFDYAYFNIKLLGNQSIIIYNKTLQSCDVVIEKFKKEFDVYFTVLMIFPKSTIFCTGRVTFRLATKNKYTEVYLFNKFFECIYTKHTRPPKDIYCTLENTSLRCI